MENSLESSLVEQSLNFHGQQMLKLWESERGENDLARVGAKPLDFQVYQQRSKSLSFQDRGKRLRLQQFIVNKADSLFGARAQKDEELTEKDLQLTDTEGLYAAVPLQDVFRRLDQPAREKFLLQYMKPGGIAYCTVITNNKFSGTLIMKVLCLEDLPYGLTDLNIKAFCQLSKSVLAVPPAGGEPRAYCTGDIVRCEIVESHPTSEKIVCGMKGECSGGTQAFGLISADQLPQSFRQQEQMELTYEQMLEQSVGFHNPNSTGLLASLLGAGSKVETDSLMTGLKGYFPENEYATELRQVQAGRWAFRSVAEGIEHFKAGRHGEAFQCLNKALNIDPRNTEGLVARGALYANSGSFEKAIEDFEDALKSNPTHQNARKYLAETLVAYGRKFEEENNFDQAMKSYERCLTVIPYHEEAQNSIKYLQNKIANKGATPVLPDIFLPGLNPAKTMEVKETLKQLLRRNTSEHERSHSKKKRGRKHKRHYSSSSSSSTSDSSHSSSSSSSSRDSSSGSSHSRSKKQRKHSKKRSQSKNKEKSLSPLSKRMALLDPTHGGFNEAAVTALGALTGQLGHHPLAAAAAAATSRFPFGQAAPLLTGPTLELLGYDQRLRQLLEQVKGEGEGEQKLRKLLEDTDHLRKDSKTQDRESRKKKKKEKVKAKDKEKSKKKKKDKDREEKKKKHKDKGHRSSRVTEQQAPRSDDEYLYGPSPDLTKDEQNSVAEREPEDVDTKLSIPYGKVEKASMPQRSRWDDEVVKEKKRMSSESPGPKMKKRYSSESSQEQNFSAKEKRKMDIFASSPTPPPLPPPPPMMKDSRVKQETIDPLAGKWKGMVIPSAKLKGKKKPDKDNWDEFEEKRFAFNDEDSDAGSEQGKHRKSRRPSEAEDSVKKEEEDALDSVNRAQQYMTKYQGGYRVSGEKKSALAESSLPPEHSPPKPPVSLPPRAESTSKAAISSDSDSERGKRNGPSVAKKRPSKSPSSSGSGSTRSRSAGARHRSRSRSPVRRRKSRSRSFDSRSRSRSRSYKYSRSRSRGSRSRSRSRSYSRRRSRSYSRSRSRSDDRRRYDSRSKYPNRYQRRGPQYYRSRGGGYQQHYNKSPRLGQGGYGNRNQRGGYYQNKYQQRGGRGNYIRRNQRQRGRYYNKPGPSYYNRDRRYDHRARSRDRYSSSPERNRSYRSGSDDTMRKVDEAKERINKTIAEKEEARRHQSDGEEEEGEI